MYCAQITRRHKGAVVILLDRSGSMAERVHFGGREMTKAEALCECVNALLEELINRCYREFYVGDYFDVAIIGYSGDKAESLLGSGFRRLTDVEAMAVPVRIHHHAYTLPSGELLRTFVERHEWIAPSSEGRTPMGSALRMARRLCAAWCRKHPESFPPLVINITDGEVTDASPDEVRSLAARLREVGTEDGKTLLMNIHLANRTEGNATSLRFPSEGAPLPLGRHTQLLYDISSTLPALYNDAVGDIHNGAPPYRAICYNAPIEELVGLLAIGSRTIDQML